jgi:hypothetical protein
LVTLGLVRYKDKKLVLIGFAAILFTIAVYGLLFYFSEYSATGRKMTAEIAQEQLNSLVKEVEFYKLQTGQYPDSLEQIQAYSKLAFIYDPLSTKATGNTKKFTYQRSGEQYSLHSVGIDMINNTEDDIYPSTDSKKTGLLKAVKISNNCPNDSLLPHELLKMF